MVAQARLCCRTLCFLPRDWRSTRGFWLCVWVTMSCTWGGGNQIPLRFSKWKLRLWKKKLQSNKRGVLLVAIPNLGSNIEKYFELCLPIANISHGLSKHEHTLLSAHISPYLIRFDALPELLPESCRIHLIINIYSLDLALNISICFFQGLCWKRKGKERNLLKNRSMTWNSGFRPLNRSLRKPREVNQSSTRYCHWG